MTISKTGRSTSTAGNGSTTVFNFGYRFMSAADLDVYLINDTTGVATLQTITTHYSVSNNDDETGGSVTMVTAPASGETLLIERTTALTQSADYAASDSFPSDSHETALDKLMLIAQDVYGEGSRHLTFPVTDTASGALAQATTRASKLLGFDSGGGLSYYDTTGLAQTFATRAEFATWVAAGGVLADGQVVAAGRALYVGEDGATAIPDLAGVLPFDKITSDHFAQSGEADDTLAINRAIDYANSLAGTGLAYALANDFREVPVFLDPKRDHSIGSKIVLKSGVHLVGDGAKANLFLAYNGRALETYDYEAQKAGSSTDVTLWPGLKDLVFHGESATYAAGEGVFLSEAGGSFDGIEIHDFALEGFERAGSRTPDFAEDDSGNYPLYKRKVESHYGTITTMACGGASNLAFYLGGAGDTTLVDVIHGGCDGGIEWASESTNVMYCHTYACGAALSDTSYATTISAQASFGYYEVRDNDFGGLLITSDETKIGTLEATKNGRKAVGADTYQVAVTGARCEVAGYVQAKDQSGAAYDGNGTIPCFKNAGSQNVLDLQLLGSISSVRTSTLGYHHASGANCEVELVADGFDGPAIQFDGGDYLNLEATIRDSDVGLEKNATSLGGQWSITANSNVTDAVDGTTQTVATTESIRFLYGGTDLASFRAISSDVVADATGTGQLTIAHGLMSQPAFTDIMCTATKGSTTFPGDAEIEVAVESRDATNVYIRWRVRTASGTGGARFAVAVWGRLGSI